MFKVTLLYKSSFCTDEVRGGCGLPEALPQKQTNRTTTATMGGGGGRWRDGSAIRSLAALIEKPHSIPDTHLVTKNPP